MKTITYVSCHKYTSGSVIVCVDDALTVNGAPFIEASLSPYGCGCSCTCGCRHSYQISYDEAQLLDPDAVFNGCDITGIVERGCLTQYIDWMIANSIPS